MKMATVFLVTLNVFTTLFLAPAGIAARSVEINKRDLSTLINSETARRAKSLTGLVNILGDPLGHLKREWFEKPAQEFVSDEVYNSDFALADIKKAVNKGLTEATGDKKEILSEVNDWLIKLGPMVKKLHSGILAAVNNGTKNDLGNSISRIVKTFAQNLPEVAKYMVLLGATPGKRTTPVLLVFTVKLASNLIRAFLVGVVLRLLEIGASLVSVNNLISLFIPF